MVIPGAVIGKTLGTIGLLSSLWAADGGVSDAAATPASRPEVRPDAGTPRERSLLDPLPRPVIRSGADQSYKLKPAKDGSGDLLYEEAGFKARVAVDGTVRFDDKRVSDLKWSFMPRRLYPGVPSLEATIKGLLRGKGPPPPAEAPDPNGPPPETTTVIPEVTRYRPDPREGCRTCPILNPLYPNVSGRWDLTDEIMRLNGQDPYRYQKAKFLVGTREVRIRMAVKTHADNVRRASSELPARLRVIGCDERLSPRDRRGILEALRSEMRSDSREGQEAAAAIELFLEQNFRPEMAPEGPRPACAPDRGGPPAPGRAPAVPNAPARPLP